MNEERNVPESVTATDLARFEDQLRAQRAPAIEYLRPGLARATRPSASAHTSIVRLSGLMPIELNRCM